MQKKYRRVMLGKKSSFASQCISEGFIGADFGIRQNLSGSLSENWRDFNKQFIPIFLNNRPEKTRISAGLACGMLHTLCKGLSIDDIVMSPDGAGNYHFGKITSDYYYVDADALPHRRKVSWFEQVVARTELSDGLQMSAGSSGTVVDIAKHSEEIERLILGETNAKIVSTDSTIEDASVFAMEKHLEEFLIRNWLSTALGKSYDIYTEEGEVIGQQYPTDTGYIDILAVSKDRKEILVVELKRGRASDVVVGQVQRYMGYIMSELAEQDQSVRGCIIALDDDIRIRHALRVNPLIDFYRYEVSFKLNKS